MPSGLSSSLEDYLEAIYNLQKTSGKVRVTDISTTLSVEKPSVNSAVQKLKHLKLVLHEPYEAVQLTAKGETEARRIRLKHQTLYYFLYNILGMTAAEAETDACRLEHAISTHTLERLSEFVDICSRDDVPGIKRWRKRRAAAGEKEPQNVDPS